MCKGSRSGASSPSVADAGNERREEVDLVARGQSGLNLGWPCFEGTLPFDNAASCAGAVPPLPEYPREGGSCAIVGGVVVWGPPHTRARGPVRPWRLLQRNDHRRRGRGREGAASDELDVAAPHLSSFGVDGVGCVHVTSTDGSVYRIDPAPPG